MSHVVLAYSHHDAPIAQRLRTDLTASGIQVWTDARVEADTPAWQNAVQTAIQNAAGVAVVLSPYAKQAEWSDFVIECARSGPVPVFPVLAWGTESTAIPIDLINAQWVDLRAEYAPKFKTLVSTLYTQVGITPQPPPANLPTTLPPTIGELAYTFNFTPEELEQNRQGKPSSAQRQRYRVRAWVLLALGLLMFALAMLVGSSGLMIIVRTIFIILGLAFMLGLYEILLGKTYKTTGPMKRIPRQNTLPHMEIGGVGLVVSFESWERARETYPGQFTAYYIRLINRLLSVEPVTEDG